MDEYTEGICGDGTVILLDGQRIPITEVLAQLNRIRDLEAEIARLKKDARHWWNMIEFTDATSVRDIHALAQDGCRLFYLRPTEGK